MANLICNRKIKVDKWNEDSGRKAQDIKCRKRRETMQTRDDYIHGNKLQQVREAPLDHGRLHADQSRNYRKNEHYHHRYSVFGCPDPSHPNPSQSGKSSPSPKGQQISKTSPRMSVELVDSLYIIPISFNPICHNRIHCRFGHEGTRCMQCLQSDKLLSLCKSGSLLKQRGFVQILKPITTARSPSVASVDSSNLNTSHRNFHSSRRLHCWKIDGDT